MAPWIAVRRKKVYIFLDVLARVRWILVKNIGDSEDKNARSGEERVVTRGKRLRVFLEVLASARCMATDML